MNLVPVNQPDGSSFADYDDWRMPNIKELQSIVHYSGVYPAIDGDFFNITDTGSYFWSSTSGWCAVGTWTTTSLRGSGVRTVQAELNRPLYRCKTTGRFSQ